MKKLILIGLFFMIGCGGGSSSGNGPDLNTNQNGCGDFFFDSASSDHVKRMFNGCENDLARSFTIQALGCTITLKDAFNGSDVRAALDDNGRYEFSIGNEDCIGYLDDDFANGFYALHCFDDGETDGCEMDYYPN